jgi:hypothetical protein
MEQTFTCPECGRQITYRPEECPLFTRHEAIDGKAVSSRSRIVYCAG